MRPSPPPEEATWRAAGRALVAKTIAELCYEQLLAPRPAGDGGYALRLPGGVAYRFTARRGAFATWRVDPDSVWRQGGDATARPADDAARLLVDARAPLGLGGATLADAVRELVATQAADARLRATAPTAAALADLDYAALEGHGAGHPCMIANKGRIGFSAGDLARYAPEARRPLRLRWIAASPELARYAGLPELGPSRLLDAELDAATRQRFAHALAAALDGTQRAPQGYIWLPVHPWHLDEAVVPLFAALLADRRIVPLGEGPDRYVPLQSVRTLANVDHPARRDVKLPLLVRNTLVWRGLAPRPTAAAPAVTSWLHRLRDTDPFLRDDCRFLPLGEVASVTVRHPLYEAIPDAPYRYHELLGAVWREPVAALLEPGERARSMAALLHVDAAGRALAAELVDRSGVAPHRWLRAFLTALLPPLLHHLYRHGVGFCPHGENTIIIYDERDVPRRIAVKDFAEDVNLLPEPHPSYADLPPEADAVLLRWDARQLRHCLLSAVFAGHFRHFAGIVEDHLGVAEPEFWRLVAEEVRAYQRRFPDLAEAFAAFDLLAPEFERVCLNREHLQGAAFHDRAERDEGFDLFVGHVDNPLAGAPAQAGR